MEKGKCTTEDELKQERLIEAMELGSSQYDLLNELLELTVKIALMNQKKKITVPMSEEDLQELQRGETFDWTFDDVDVHIEQGEEQEICHVCGYDLAENEYCVNPKCKMCQDDTCYHCDRNLNEPKTTEKSKACKHCI